MVNGQQNKIEKLVKLITSSQHRPWYSLGKIKIKLHEMKKEKNYSDFLIIKIWSNFEGFC